MKYLVGLFVVGVVYAWLGMFAVFIEIVAVLMMIYGLALFMTRLDANAVFRSMGEFRRREIDAHLFGVSQTENRHPTYRPAPTH